MDGKVSHGMPCVSTGSADTPLRPLDRVSSTFDVFDEGYVPSSLLAFANSRRLAAFMTQLSPGSSIAQPGSPVPWHLPAQVLQSL